MSNFTKMCPAVQTDWQTRQTDSIHDKSVVDLQ